VDGGGGEAADALEGGADGMPVGAAGWQKSGVDAGVVDARPISRRPLSSGADAGDALAATAE